MGLDTVTGTLAPMDNRERGEAIKARMEHLGENPTSLARLAHVDRGTVNRAMEGHPGVKSISYDAIETALREREYENDVHGPDLPTVIPSLEIGLVELDLTIEGGVTVRAVVKGPVTNIEDLERTITKMAAHNMALARQQSEETDKDSD